MANRTPAKVTQEIQDLAEKRQELWRSGDPSGEAPSIAGRLDALYEERRILQNGTIREDVVKRARVETELERLMSG